MPTTTVIPCRLPKVTVEPSPIGGGGLYDHVCHVPGCGWTYRSVKSDHLGAPHHRREHRAAVPDTELVSLASGVYQARCSCGWYREAPGVHTRADNEAALAYHLSHDHGLVSC